MDGYIAKPIQIDRLVELVESIRDAEDDREPEAFLTARQPPLDGPALLKRVDGDLALLKRMLTPFLSDTPRQLETIRQALESRDATGIERTAHAQEFRRRGTGIGQWDGSPPVT